MVSLHGRARRNLFEPDLSEEHDAQTRSGLPLAKLKSYVMKTSVGWSGFHRSSCPQPDPTRALTCDGKTGLG